MNIKRRIWSVPLVSTLIFGAGVGASAWLASGALESIRTTGSVHYPVLDQAKSLSGVINAVPAALRDAVGEGDKERIAQVGEQATLVRASIARFGAIAGQAEQARRLASEFDAYYRPALASARIMLELEPGDAAASVKDMQAALAILNADLEQLNARAARQFTDGIVRSEAQVNRVLWSSILAALAVIASLVLVSHFAVRAIWRQLGGEPEYARAIAHAVASGDLSMEIRTEAGDNTSLLAALREMRKRLGTMVSNIKHSADTIHVASAEIANGNADLASRTEAQAGSLEHTTRAMETLMDTVRQNARHADDANTLVLSASGDAGRGGSAVHEVVTTMGDISSAARKIVDIIGVIDGIAFQTNILALNAAVEAARAGEQGRGFAVVASEVRNLAQRSAAAAREIKTVIVATVEQVEAGALQVDRAGATMDQIVASVAQVAAIMGDISAASKSQIEGLGHIGNAIGHIDGMTQQNSALVEEAAAAAASLTGEAEQLARALGNFKLARTGPGAQGKLA